MSLSYLILGSGAIGKLVGVQLSAAGEDITFLVRDRVAQHIKDNGIKLTGAMGDTSLAKPTITTNLNTVLDSKKIDVVILAVKSFHTSSVINLLKSATKTSPTILCLQNGVDNEDLLSDAFGIENVIPGTVTSAVSISKLGAVNVDRERGIGIAAGHPYSLEIWKAFNSAGFDTLLYPNAKAMKWSKLITNILANATAAICDITPNAIFKHDRLFRLEINAIEETLTVMKGLQLPIVRLPRTPSHWLAFAIKRLPPWSYRAILNNKVSKGRGGKHPSLQVDLLANRNHSEISYLNGTVHRHAKALGLAAPVNHGLANILGRIVAGGIPWDKYRHNPDGLADSLLSGDF
ncbi:MAG: 2-dehydropantoate 2-reductase [Chloroflexi bacterium]|nr:2-dehydropantoate 2-reductase [Chloroflexota bacterium]